MKKQNNLKSLFVLTKYTFISSIKNPSTLVFGFIFPFVFILVFGLIGNGGNGKFDIGVLSNSDKDSYIYQTILKKSDSINLIEDKTDDQLNDELSKGQIPATIDIVKTGEVIGGVPQYKIELSTTSASQTSPVVLEFMNSVVEHINNPPQANEQKVVELSTTNIEGRKYTSIDFILPGQLGFALLSSGVFGIAFSFVSLRKTLVLKRIFATPTPKWVILVSKVLSSMVMAVLQAIVIIGVGHFVFNFTLSNGILTFLSMVLLSMIGLLVFFGLGLLVASVGKDEDSIPPIANLITLPQFLLSGTFFSIDLFPDFLKPIAKILPMTFLNDALRKVAFEGAPLTDVLPQIGALALWGIVIYIFVIRTFKWE